MPRKIQWLPLAIFSFSATPALAADSAYTKHDYEKCRLVKKEEPTAQWRRCRGFGGIALNWQNEDDGAGIDFGERGSEDD